MKARKAFCKLDIVLYLILLVSIFLLFLFFVILPKSVKANGFEITFYDEVVFTFDFNERSYVITDGYDVLVAENDGVYTITVTTDEGFNVIKADAVNMTVNVVDADCSIGKDCVYSPKIAGKGAIVCVPHHLTILSINGDITPPVAG